MRLERAKTIAALLTMAGALLLMFFSLRVPPPTVDSEPHMALGQVLAEETAKLASSGSRITLLAWDTSTSKNPAAEIEASSFCQALQKAKLRLSATNLVQQDPLRLIRLPTEDFLEISRKQTDSDVLVSLLGPAVLNAEQRNRLGEKRPRVVAVCLGNTPAQIDLKELFDQNLLHVVIISRTSPAAQAPAANPRERFEQLYRVVTAANVGELPLLTNSVSK